MKTSARFLTLPVILTFWLVVPSFVRGQIIKNPVKWICSAVRVDKTVYEIDMTAQMEPEWHVFSTVQPKEAVCEPTFFKFSKNDEVKYIQNIEEKEGKLIKSADEVSGIKQNYYENMVVFSQLCTYKGKHPTFVDVSITYQTCSGEICLPPKTEKFMVKIGPIINDLY